MMNQLAQPGQPPFTKSTKFNDLPDNVKKTFEDIEYVKYRCYFATLKRGFRAHIQGRVQISKDLKQRKVGEEATKGQDLIRKTHKVGRFSRTVSHLEPSH
jgi:nucleoporin p58/p45